MMNRIKKYGCSKKIKQSIERYYMLESKSLMIKVLKDNYQQHVETSIGEPKKNLLLSLPQKLYRSLLWEAISRMYYRKNLTMPDAVLFEKHLQDDEVFELAHQVLNAHLVVESSIS